MLQTRRRQLRGTETVSTEASTDRSWGGLGCAKRAGSIKPPTSRSRVYSYISPSGMCPYARRHIP